MFQVTGYETQDEFNSGKGLCYSEIDEDVAFKTHDELEKKGYWLVTTTDDNGKLIR